MFGDTFASKKTSFPKNVSFLNYINFLCWLSSTPKAEEERRHNLDCGKLNYGLATSDHPDLDLMSTKSSTFVFLKM